MTLQHNANWQRESRDIPRNTTFILTVVLVVRSSWPKAFNLNKVYSVLEARAESTQSPGRRWFPACHDVGAKAATPLDRP
jgi:hypothetical protein